MAFYSLKRSHKTFFRLTHITTLVVLCLTILSFSSSHFVKADPDCKAENGTYVYDLSPLTRTDKDWIVGNETEKFYINICRGVLFEDPDDISSTRKSVYQKNSLDNKGSSFGEFIETNSPIIRGDKLVMEFTDEKKSCHRYDNTKRGAVISFICDNTVDNQAGPVLVSNYKDCVIFFEWRTPVACKKVKETRKTEEDKEGWSVFFTIFVIALIVYFVGGVVYNRTVHNASGWYQIPNWEFWSNAFDFLKDMILIILAQCPTFKPRRSRGRNYSNLPRDEENILIEEEFEEH